MTLSRPYFLFLGLLIPLYLYLRFFTGKGKGLPLTLQKGHFSSGIRVSFRFLPELFLLLSFALMILVLARPQKVLSYKPLSREGIAIEMVIDRSSSMSAKVDGFEGNRLDLVKDVFREFILGNDRNLPGRPNDLVGLVRFARYADTQAPLTLSHNVLVQFLDTMDLVDRPEEDGTSIGDAVVLAAARLKDAELKSDVNYKLKGKAIILLTDGISNMGQYTPLEAAQQAAEWEIPIYAIGFREMSLGQMLLGIGGYGPDGTILEQMAEITGGRFFEATNARELEEVYREIDQLEPSRVESTENQNREEYFRPFLIASLICLFLYFLSDSLLFRRVSV